MLPTLGYGSADPMGDTVITRTLRHTLMAAAVIALAGFAWQWFTTGWWL